MNKTIACFGQLQNGKSTIVDYLSEELVWKKVAFAKKVKEIFCDAFDVDLAFIEKWKVIPEPPPGFDMPVRQSLQFIGDGFRKIMPDIWVSKCFRLNEPPMIIEDGRYINELIKIKDEQGCNILVWRPGMENDDPNGSEAQMRPLVDWFKNLPDNFEGDTSSLFATATGKWCIAGHLAPLPHGADKVDYFVRNEGTIEELYIKLKNNLIPYLEEKIGV